ncbi:hypothetical protein [Rickettsia felis]|uniref:hypothetical protein n=1 Tax=Rickettsia felis TaxID=42862 RepID=UPI0009D6DEE3|nr:hypothetical protein [Rickettsia felis]
MSFPPGIVPWIPPHHCEKNYIVIRQSNLRSLLLFHEIATQPTAARNDEVVSTEELARSYFKLYVKT